MEVRQLRYTKRSLDDVRSELTSRSNPVDGSLRSSLNSTQVSQRSGKAMSSPRGKEAALSCFWTATEDARHIGNMWLPLLAQTVTAVVLPCLDLAVTCGSYVVTRLRFGVLGARPPPHALHLQRPSKRGERSPNRAMKSSGSVRFSRLALKSSISSGPKMFPAPAV